MGILDQPKATHKIHNHSFSSHHWNQSLCRRLGFVDLRARKKKEEIKTLLVNKYTSDIL